MSITLYYGSGSPFAWRVQLALEHKALPYERKVLSFSAGDTTKPEFVALNPRHRVPTLTDGDFAIYESNALVAYLEAAYPGRGAALFPGDARSQATVWRLMMEVDNYVQEATDSIVEYAFYTKPEERQGQKLVDARKAVSAEFAQMARYLKGDFLAGPLSAADFSLYPPVAFMWRCRVKLPDFDADGLLTPELRAWKKRMDALPYMDKTIPPHWKQT
ncbi:MAG TPA: glutathione S-transferase family protein [Casimicrobiaceae bacterium]|nr:glutathione S-transferase family protein [Casimicrobiaceae bacterium]